MLGFDGDDLRLAGRIALAAVLLAVALWSVAGAFGVAWRLFGLAAGLTGG